jgi:hypothetical protein
MFNRALEKRVRALELSVASHTESLHNPDDGLYQKLNYLRDSVAPFRLATEETKRLSEWRRIYRPVDLREVLTMILDALGLKLVAHNAKPGRVELEPKVKAW